MHRAAVDQAMQTTLPSMRFSLSVIHSMFFESFLVAVTRSPTSLVVVSSSVTQYSYASTSFQYSYSTAENSYLLKDKQCIQQITRPRMGKKASWRATPFLSIVHNYVSAFTTNKPDPTPCTVIYSLGVVAK